MAESLEMMFKYILMTTIYDISDVDIVKKSCYDMSFKYILGIIRKRATGYTPALCGSSSSCNSGTKIV